MKKRRKGERGTPALKTYYLFFHQKEKGKKVERNWEKVRKKKKREEVLLFLLWEGNGKDRGRGRGREGKKGHHL